MYSYGVIHKQKIKPACAFAYLYNQLAFVNQLTGTGVDATWENQNLHQFENFLACMVMKLSVYARKVTSFLHKSKT